MSEETDEQPASSPDATLEAAATASKVLPVICQEEIYRYIDLGLGRGLDGTDQTPWLNKTSFQARRVKFDNILGTEEGGSVQSYEREISSVQTLQSKLKSSIVLPKPPMIIGTDAELSRTVNSSRRAVGRQIINRTVSFKDDFVDAPCSDDIISEYTGGSSDMQNHWTFEQRLANWIIQKLKASWQKPISAESTISVMSSIATAAKKLPPLTLPTETMTGKCPLSDLLYIIDQHRKPDLQFIIKGCEDFLDYFRVTHYVSAIELGAAEYRVLTEDEYQISVSTAGSFGIEKLASIVTQHNFSSKKKSKASELKRIGMFTSDDKVERGSYSEAVVNVAIKSILTLIKTDFLHEAMSAALVKFVDSQSDRSNGPFLITCGIVSGLFLEVDPETHAVGATTDASKATRFQIIPSDDKYNEFYIAFQEEKSRILRRRRYSVFRGSEPGSTVAMYLNAPVNIRGLNNGPLYMSDTVSDESSRFVLHSRIIQNKVSPVSISTWTSGNEMFYLNCSRRKRRINGYLALKRVRERGRDTYITACMDSRKYHNSSSVYMLFQLIPSYLAENETEEDGEGENDEIESVQLEQLEVEESKDTLL